MWNLSRYLEIRQVLTLFPEGLHMRGHIANSENNHSKTSLQGKSRNGNREINKALQGKSGNQLREIGKSIKRSKGNREID